VSALIIRVEGLGKEYVIGGREKASATVRDAVATVVAAPWRRLRKLSGRVEAEERFWALKDVSFEVNEGEVIGVIGRNGAGKSTLLKILSRITAPTQGRVEIRGRMASLLEVGTGFHPELSGRENIYLNGAVLGMSRAEIKRKFDDIITFAEIEKFLDTPVKRYSSGMYLRLAFAVAAHLEPDILVVDEVLAVGDADFQKRCLGKLSEAARGGRTVLFVSHNMAAVHALTSRAILLSKGRVMVQGATSNVVSLYLTPAKPVSDQTTLGESATGSILVSDLLVNGLRTDCLVLEGHPCRIDINLKGRSNISSRLSLEAELVTADGFPVASYCPGHFTEAVDAVRPGTFELNARIDLAAMTAGRYYLNMFLTEPHRQGHWEYQPGLILDIHGTLPTSGAGVISRRSGHGVFLLSGQQSIKRSHAFQAFPLSESSSDAVPQ
jgi:lipopolysaccharide transport system ATP-binding protein